MKLGLSLGRFGGLYQARHLTRFQGIVWIKTNDLLLIKQIWWVWGIWEQSSASPRNPGVDSAVPAASLLAEHMESLGVNRAVQMVKRAPGVEGSGKGRLSWG